MVGSTIARYKFFPVTYGSQGIVESGKEFSGAELRDAQVDDGIVQFFVPDDYVSLIACWFVLYCAAGGGDDKQVRHDVSVRFCQANIDVDANTNSSSGTGTDFDAEEIKLDVGFAAMFGGNLLVHDYVTCKYTRQGGHGDDNFTASVFLIGVEFRYYASVEMEYPAYILVEERQDDMLLYDTGHAQYEQRRRNYVVTEVDHSPHFDIGSETVSWGEWGITGRNSRFRVHINHDSPYVGKHGVEVIVTVKERDRIIASQRTHRTTDGNFVTPDLVFPAPKPAAYITFEVEIS